VADSGFYNIAPLNNQAIAVSPQDNRYPGDVRQALMNDIMNKIFTHNGW
jgi:hypothetical protein